MFQNHKYCVIHVSGLLAVFEAPSGMIRMYLVDGAAEGKDELLSKLEQSLSDSSSGEWSRDHRINVTDPALRSFITHQASRSKHPLFVYLMDVQITGTINPDDREIELLEVTRAVMNDGEKVLKFEP